MNWTCDETPPTCGDHCRADIDRYTTQVSHIDYEFSGFQDDSGITRCGSAWLAFDGGADRRLRFAAGSLFEAVEIHRRCAMRPSGTRLQWPPQTQRRNT